MRLFRELEKRSWLILDFALVFLKGKSDFGFLRIGLSFGYWFDWFFTINQLLIQTYNLRHCLSIGTLPILDERLPIFCRYSLKRLVELRHSPYYQIITESLAILPGRFAHQLFNPNPPSKPLRPTPMAVAQILQHSIPNRKEMANIDVQKKNTKTKIRFSF